MKLVPLKRTEASTVIINADMIVSLEELSPTETTIIFGFSYGEHGSRYRLTVEGGLLEVVGKIERAART